MAPPRVTARHGLVTSIRKLRSNGIPSRHVIRQQLFPTLSPDSIRNAARRVPQLSAILLHRGQAGEIAKTQLPCVYIP
jgi:hypothetical protein